MKPRRYHEWSSSSSKKSVGHQRLEEEGNQFSIIDVIDRRPLYLNISTAHLFSCTGVAFIMGGMRRALQTSPFDNTAATRGEKWWDVPRAIVLVQGLVPDAGPLAQSVELCTYEVDSRYARVPSSILGGSTVLFFLSSKNKDTACNYNRIMTVRR